MKRCTKTMNEMNKIATFYKKEVARLRKKSYPKPPYLIGLMTYTGLLIMSLDRPPKRKGKKV